MNEALRGRVSALCLTLCLALLMGPAASTLLAQGDGGETTTKPADKPRAGKPPSAQPGQPTTEHKDTHVLWEKIRREQRVLFRELLQGADEDKDQKLSAEELGDPRKGLLMFERDGDGRLGEIEFMEGRGAAYMELIGRLSRDSWTAGDMESRMALYMQRDTNSDNALSSKEAPELFVVEADENNDGKITFLELMTYWEKDPDRRLIMELDLNGDGRLATTEVPELGWSHSNVDADSDGFYVQSELRKHFAKISHSDRFKVQSDALFARFDADGDGVIKGDELAAVTGRYEGVDANKNSEVTRKELADAIWQTHSRRRDLTPHWAQLMGKDSDRDLALTANEIENFANYAREVDQNKDGVIAIHELIAFDRRSRKEPVSGLSFGMFDRDRDGKITSKEYPGFFKKKLKIDANEDGIITEAEFNEHFNKKKS